MVWSIQECAAQDCRAIGEGLVAYNLRQVPMTQREPFISVNRKAVDESGTLLAGCIAEIYCWNVAYVELLWVDERYRGMGLGSELLAEVERTAAVFDLLLGDNLQGRKEHIANEGYKFLDLADIS